jgi:hypothetical protein
MEKYTAIMEMSGYEITWQSLGIFAVSVAGLVKGADLYDWGKEKFSSHKEDTQFAAEPANHLTYR